MEAPPGPPAHPLTVHLRGHHSPPPAPLTAASSLHREALINCSLILLYYYVSFIHNNLTVPLACEVSWNLVMKTLTSLIASLVCRPPAPHSRIVPVCLSLSLCLCLSVSLSLFLYLHLYVSVSPSLSPSPSLWERGPPGGSGDPSRQAQSPAPGRVCRVVCRPDGCPWAPLSRSQALPSSAGPALLWAVLGARF